MIKRHTKNGLDATQKIIASEIAYMPFSGKTLTEIAKENNINRSTIFRWKQFENFNNEVNRISNEIQRSYLPLVHNKLIQCINSENEKTILKAIELYYKQQNLINNSDVVAIKTDNNINIDTLLNELKDF